MSNEASNFKEQRDTPDDRCAGKRLVSVLSRDRSHQCRVYLSVKTMSELGVSIGDPLIIENDSDRSIVCICSYDFTVLLFIGNAWPSSHIPFNRMNIIVLIN